MKLSKLKAATRSRKLCGAEIARNGQKSISSSIGYVARASGGACEVGGSNARPHLARPMRKRARGGLIPVAGATQTPAPQPETKDLPEVEARKKGGNLDSKVGK